MIEVRALKPADIPSVTQRAVAIAQRRYPGLQVDAAKVRGEVEFRISNLSHYAVRCGESLFLAETQDLPFSRNKASVVTLVDVVGRGEGVSLWRSYKKWLSARPGIKLAAYAPLSDLPAAFEKFMLRLGFQRRGSVYECWRTT